MRIIKSFFIAFSMYSKIPMPQFEWKDEDMRYALCFFPWVGAVIGVLWYLWKWICARFGVGTLCYTVVGTAIPILITGGEYFDYQAKCGQGYSGILVFPMGGGAPECKDFHPLSKSGLSEFT